MDELNLRYAVADDLDFVSRVVTEVSEGIVECLFADLLPMQQASDVLRLAFGRNVAPYVTENVIFAADKARDLSLKKIALHAFAENEAALGLYRKAGFEELKEVTLGAPLSARHPKGGRVLSKTLDTPA